MRHTYTAQPSRADPAGGLGGFAYFLGVQVDDAVTGGPGPGGGQSGACGPIHDFIGVYLDNVTMNTAAYLQPGLVGGGVVGQPTAVSQALYHLEP